MNVTITAKDVDTNASLIAEIVWSASTATKNSRPLNLTNETIAELVQYVFYKIFLTSFKFNSFYRFLDVEYSPKNSGKINIIFVTKGNISETRTPDYELFDSLYLCLRVTDLNTDPDFMINNSTIGKYSINFYLFNISRRLFYTYF